MAIPISFFVQGFTWSVFGLFESDIHLFGIDPAAATAAPSDDPTAPAPIPPKLLPWGADSQGRDVYSRVLQGARISMLVGLIGVAISTVIGSILGTASGYFGGTADNLMQRLIELIQSIPTLPLYAAIAAALPSNTTVTQRFF